MWNKYILSLILTGFGILHAQMIPSPSFNFSGLKAEWFHQFILDREINGSSTFNLSEQCKQYLPQYIKDDFTYCVIDDNQLFDGGTNITKIKNKDGQIIWKKFINASTTKEKYGFTDFNFLSIDTANIILLGQSVIDTFLNPGPTSKISGFPTERIISLRNSDEISTKTNLSLKNLLFTRSTPIRQYSKVGKYFFYQVKNIDSDSISNLIIPYTFNENLVPEMINDTNKIITLYKPGTNILEILGPFTNNEGHRLYFVVGKIKFSSYLNHHIFQTDSFGNVLKTLDINSMLQEISEEDRLIETQYLDKLNLIQAKLYINDLSLNRPRIGLVYFDINGNLIYDQKDFKIENKRVWSLSTIFNNENQLLIHCVKFFNDKNVYFYSEDAQHNYYKLGVMEYPQHSIYDFAPKYTRLDNENNIVQSFNVYLDSAVLGSPAYTYGGWYFIAKISKGDLNFKTNKTAQLLNSILFYPNPVTDEIEANIDLTEYTLELIDYLGKTLVLPSQSNNHVINLNGIISGIYLLRISNKSGFIKNIKVVKK